MFIQNDAEYGRVGIGSERPTREKEGERERERERGERARLAELGSELEGCLELHSPLGV